MQQDIRVEGIIGILSFIISSVLIARICKKGNIKPAWICSIYVAFPTVLIYLWNLVIGHSISDFLALVLSHPIIYMVVALFLSVSCFVGGLIDSAVALCKFRAQNRTMRLTWEQKYHVVKYGAPDKVVKNKGVYDFCLSNIIYDLMANLTGALCPIAICAHLRTLSGYLQFLHDTHWIDCFALIGPFMVIPALQGIKDAQGRERPASVLKKGANPDNYLFNRAHVFFSAISLWFTDTMVVLFGFTFIIFKLKFFQQISLDLSIMLPFVALTLFVAFLTFSSATANLNSASVVGYWIGMGVFVILILFSIITSEFRWSTTIILLTFILILLLVWRYFIKRIKIISEKKGDWEKKTTWIPIMIGGTIILLSVLVALQIYKG